MMIFVSCENILFEESLVRSFHTTAVPLQYVRETGKLGSCLRLLQHQKKQFP